MHSFSRIVVNWYKKNKRDLPWRHESDPYRIWISEIILQQTRVEQGLPYYLRFAKKYPTVFALAKAPEKEVLKLWQGLGYYSRARNLHATAKYISRELNGKFPATYNELIKLKGVGSYTAGAIASFSFGEARPVVDGNVFRLLARYFGIHTPIDSGNGKKEFYALAYELLDKKDPGTYNQAIMEFGAMQCTPKNPGCENCPLNDSCYAFTKKTIPLLPVKGKKTKITYRYLHYLVIGSKGHLLLNHREGKDIWKGLYDFPHIESEKQLGVEKIISSKEFRGIIGKNKCTVKKISPVYKHVLSHQKIFATFFEVDVTSFQKNKKFIPVNRKKLGSFAVPKLIERYLLNRK